MLATDLNPGDEVFHRTRNNYSDGNLPVKRGIRRIRSTMRLIEPDRIAKPPAEIRLQQRPVMNARHSTLTPAGKCPALSQAYTLRRITKSPVSVLVTAFPHFNVSHDT